MKSGWLSHAVAAGTFLTANAVSGEEFLGGNGGFELGDLSSWTVVSGGGWDVVEFDHPGKSGRFYASTCNEIWPGDGGCKNGNGERDTGVLTSAVFTAPGGYLEFRISGFNGPSCDNGLSHVSLRRASDHEELRKELLPCQNPFKLHRWSLEDLAGEEVYIRVEDADAAPSWAVMAVDGFRLTSEPPDSLAPAPSDSSLSLAGSEADGITFTSRPDGWQMINTIEDGEVRQVVPHVDWKLWNPSWSPDGRTLAAVSNRFTSNQEIYLFYFGPDGEAAGLRALTNHRGADNQPAWSPDGRRIAFVSDRTGEGDLYLVPATGGDPVRLTQGAPVSRPSWSPDGGRIAFSQEGDIRSVDPLTGEVTVLSDAPEWEGYPSWSPGGGRIAFSADGELAILDLQQGTRRRITRGYFQVAYPSWSPDRGLHRLLFVPRGRFGYLSDGSGLGAHSPDHPCPRHLGQQGAGLESREKRGFPPAGEGARQPREQNEGRGEDPRRGGRGGDPRVHTAPSPAAAPTTPGARSPTRTATGS